MSNGRQLFVVAIILAAFGGLVVAGGPALAPGETPDETAAIDAPDEQDEDDERESEQNDTEQVSIPAAVEPCAAEPPADFADPEGGNSETIGWVDGYWYNEPLDIDAAEGLDETELEQLSARTAARFEAMRCLTADEGVPPVEIQTREEFQEEQSALFEGQPEALRLFDNVKLETLMLADSETDATDEREANRGATVGGTYDFINNEIVIVTDDPENLQIDEQILAHELGHAIQDQQFNLSRYERPTVDQDKGKLALIEGDVHLIEQRYLEACTTGEWNQECITDDGEANGEGDDIDDLNWGLYFKQFQPYSDGPAFVQHVYETGDGWESVDELYENPPTSAIQVIKPERFPELQRQPVEVPDQSTDDWERIGTEFDTNHDTIGPAGISAMFMTPAVETGGFVSIYEQEAFITGDNFNPFEYRHPETEGWRGDRIYAYQGPDNATGSVWTLQWEDEAAWEPFVDSYREMIEFRGGDPVADDELTYEFEDGYEMALTIEPSGDQVTVVTAPTVDQLDEVHDVSPV